jgi:hypothetical protein
MYRTPGKALKRIEEDHPMPHWRVSGSSLSRACKKMKYRQGKCSARKSGLMRRPEHCPEYLYDALDCARPYIHPYLNPIW